MTENIRALIMSAAALAPLVVWYLCPSVTLGRITSLAVCSVVIVGVVLAIPVPHDDDHDEQ